MPRITSGTRRGQISRRTFLGAAAQAGLLTLPLRAGSVVRSPYVQNVRTRGASVLWTHSTRQDSILKVLDDSGTMRTITPEIVEFTAPKTGLSESYFQYRATISELRPDASYTYSIHSSSQPALALCAPAQFRTAPGASAGSFTFLHLADSGTGTDAQMRLVAQMSREDPNFVLANGDLAYDDATFSSVEQNYFGVYRDLLARVPFFASLGNHEYYTDSAAPSLAGRDAPTEGIPQRDWGRYYSFDWGNAHIVALDSNDPLTRADQGDLSMIAWLEKDLRATRKYWRIVFFHHPAYATGIHQDDLESARIRRYIVPILERYGVQLVFNGHEHTYQRTLPLLAGGISSEEEGGITYITSGGGGQRTYDTSSADWIAQRRGVNHYVRAKVAHAAMTLSAVDADGNVIDSVGLRPRPRITQPVRDAATLTLSPAAGGLATIFGSNLCTAEARPQPCAFEAYGTVVKLNGAAVPVLYADARQINVQIPFNISGTSEFTVETGNGTARIAAEIAPLAPALFAFGNEFAFAQHSDGKVVSIQSPARPGEVVRLFATGLGSVRGAIQPGEVPSSPLAVNATVQVRFNGQSIEMAESFLSPIGIGVYEVQVRVPDVSGNVSVEIQAGGVTSNRLVIPVA